MANGPSKEFEFKWMATVSEREPDSSPAGMVPFREFLARFNSKPESDGRERPAKKFGGIGPVRSLLSTMKENLSIGGEEEANREVGRVPARPVS